MNFSNLTFLISSTRKNTNDISHRQNTENLLKTANDLKGIEGQFLKDLES